MIGMDGLALMGPAPPNASTPPSQDAADGSSGFAQIMAAALAAADAGGAVQQPNASTGPTDIGAMDLELVFELLGEPGLEEPQDLTQDLTWPDRIAGAGAVESPAGSATVIAYAGQLPAVAVAVAALSEGAGPPGVAPPWGARLVVDAGFQAQVPPQARAASMPAPPAGVGVASASVSEGVSAHVGATAGASAAPQTQVEGVPYGPPQLANAGAFGRTHDAACAASVGRGARPGRHCGGCSGTRLGRADRRDGIGRTPGAGRTARSWARRIHRRRERGHGAGCGGVKRRPVMRVRLRASKRVCESRRHRRPRFVWRMRWRRGTPRSSRRDWPIRSSARCASERTSFACSCIHRSSGS